MVPTFQMRKLERLSQDPKTRFWGCSEPILQATSTPTGEAQQPCWPTWPGRAWGCPPREGTKFNAQCYVCLGWRLGMSEQVATPD